MNNSLFESLKGIEEEARVLLERLIEYGNINSHSDNYAGLGVMLEALEKDFATLPGKMERVSLGEEKPEALRITVRPDAPIQIFLCGHYDTVYPVDHEFQKCSMVDNETLHGPGVTDMKGGLIIMLGALRVMEKSPQKNRVGYEVLITPDEEIGAPLSHDLFKEAAESEKYPFGLAFEPSFPDGALARSRMGVGTFTVTAHGQASHAGRDFHKGKNAILLLAKILEHIPELHKQFPNALFNVGHIEGGGPVNVVPDYAEAKINVRTSITEEAEVIPEAINKILDSHKSEGLYAELSGKFTKLPKPITSTAENLFEAFKGCAQELGFDLEWRDTGGGSDGNTLAHYGMANIDNLGITGDYIHSAKEYAKVSSLEERVRLTSLFLLKLANQEIEIPR